MLSGGDAFGRSRCAHLVGGRRDQDEAGNIDFAGSSAQSNQSIETSIEMMSMPIRPTANAWRTTVHLWMTVTPSAFRSSTCSRSLLAAVLTIVIPFPLIARRYAA
jgi:hypothetical protein